MDERNDFLGTPSGQSTIEYLLLLLVAATMISILFNSRIFQDTLGDNSKLFSTLINNMEYSYHHGRSPAGRSDKLNFQQHDTFYNFDENRSRFFTPDP